MVTAVARMDRTPGRHVTRRIEEPRIGNSYRWDRSTRLAHLLADAHNTSVREYGSDCGGFHTFDPTTRESAGVYDGSPFPPGSVVTLLSWGRIDAALAQRLLEADGIDTETKG